MSICPNEPPDGSGVLYLALYRGASGRTVRAETYLAMDRSERALVAADLRNVTISLVVDGRERLAHQLSLGPLARLVPQIEPARRRLLAGHPALIRSGVLDVAQGHYLLIEPRAGSDEVTISLVSIGELPAAAWFPDAPQADALYDHVAANRGPLLAAARQRADGLAELRVGRAALLDSMATAAAAGRSLLAEQPQG